MTEPTARRPDPCPPGDHRDRRPRRRDRPGLSLIEMLISLGITAMLLTATMVAIDASFQAYAVAAESASTQTATRMVTHRVLGLVRTSTAHAPLRPDSAPAVPQAIRDALPADETPASPPAVTLDGDTVRSHYLELIDADGDLIRIEHLPAQNQLFAVVTPYGGGEPQAYPLLGGVTEATFHAKRRRDETGVLVLQRASIDLKVEPDRDTSLEIEAGHTKPIRLVASTMPRKLR